jgi:hypothetical protein
MWWALLLNSIVSILDSGVAAATSAYESIATVTVGGGGVSSVEFTSIPSTYTHLQLRILSRSPYSATVEFDSLTLRVNGDTGSNYSFHGLRGNGSTASADANSSIAFTKLAEQVDDAYSASIFTGVVIDLLDYANTSKYKTFRSLGGADTNGAGSVALYSGLWQSTSAVTSLKFFSGTGLARGFNQYSSFALYGIKGA